MFLLNIGKCLPRPFESGFGDCYLFSTDILIQYILDSLTNLVFQIDIEDRFIGGRKLINMVVDVTECNIQKPLDYEIQRVLFSGRSHQHCLKYEVAVEITTGLFVWFHGARPGSWNDLTIIRRSGLLDLLESKELLLADKIYQGEPQIITAFKSPTTQLERGINSIFYSHRIIVENSIGRIKTFQFTQQEWRHSLDLHPKAFKVLVQILNIDLQFRPIRKKRQRE